jgi:hypothetical protein
VLSEKSSVLSVARWRVDSQSHALLYQRSGDVVVLHGPWQAERLLGLSADAVVAPFAELDDSDPVIQVLRQFAPPKHAA